MIRSWLMRRRRGKLSDGMREDWDQRARDNAFHFVVNNRIEWSEGDFYASGRLTVEAEILSDMVNICQGREPGQMKVLEIGCGAGRVTQALAQVFGEVHGVDVSGEMIRLARIVLKDIPNAHVCQNDGIDLSVVSGGPFDFAYSSAVFAHIGSREVVETYVQQVRRLLRPGALFKFDVQGSTRVPEEPGATWLGAPYTSRQMVEMAVRNGFDPRYRAGEGQDCFWWWFFKWPAG